MNLTALIIACQTRVGAEPDGRAGPDTWGRIYAALTGVPQAADASPPLSGDEVDPRSETNIATLLPNVRPYARALILRARERGIVARVIGGTRTYAEQDALFAQGRTKPGTIVTKARGGSSNHNFGIAFDIGIFKNGDYLEESPLYKVCGALGQDLGLEWGGSWHSIVDEPHFQLRPKWAAEMSEGAMLAELRVRVASDTGVYA